MKRLAAPLVAGLVLATPAYAVAPVKGGRYTGKTSQGYKVSARVTSDGKRLQMQYRDVLRCTNGDRITGVSVFRSQAPTIREDGTIDYRKTYRDLPPEKVFPHGRDNTQRVTGAFSGGGRRASIHVVQRVKDTGGGRDCRNDVRFTLRLKG